MTCDIVTTAVCRPEILAQTYASFQKNLLNVEWDQCRLFLNVDPLPPDGMLRAKTLRVAERYFDDVECRMPHAANFAAAVGWLWSQPFRTEYVLSIEDDWELTQPIDARVMLALLAEDESLACVNLRAYPFHELGRKLLLSPGLWRAEAMRQLVGRFHPDKNPEHTLWECTDWRRRYHPASKRQVVLKDLGRSWLEQSEWKKNAPGGKEGHFTTWEKRRVA